MIDLFNADCLVQLQKMDSESVDLLVTDPPYGYSFMNKDWDKAVPRVEIWKECLRVLKAGSFAFVMSAPRSDVQAEMILKLKEAGFEVGFTPIYWAYASGFPKASNISKMVDKRLGVEPEIIGKNPNARLNADKDLYGINEKEEFNLTKPSSNEAKCLDGLFGGFQPKPAVEVVLVAMKPCVEKTFVEQALKNGHGGTWLGKCRIPYANESDRLNNTENLDRFLIGTKGLENFANEHGGGSFQGLKPTINPNNDGRFPANLLVSDNVLDNGEITESVGGLRTSRPDLANVYGKFNVFTSETPCDVGGFSRYFSLDAWWEQQIKSMPKQMREPLTKTFPFIIEPKASKGEKNEGCEELESKERKNNANFVIAKCKTCGLWIANEWRKQNRPLSSCKCENPIPQLGEQEREAVKNNHPTVKPVDLMSYLVVLGSKKGELVLDPFVGSGTTCIASELMNRKSIGIELNKEYYEIAKARVKQYQEQQRLF